MLRSTSVLALARLAWLLPFTLLSSACGEDKTSEGISAASAGASAATVAAAAGGGGINGDTQGTGGATVSSGTGGSQAQPQAGSGGNSVHTQTLGPAPVLLGNAGEYAVLAQSAISNVPTSVVTGDLGLSPAAASYITGFTLTRDGDRWTSPEVIGDVFAADNDPSTPADLTAAVADMVAAYNDAANRPTPSFLNLGDGAIGGLTLAPGLYNWTSTVTIPTDLTVSGGANDTWIFQITGDLTMAADRRITLSGGARANNIVWQVAGEVDLGTSSHAEGIVLSKTAIHLGAGASINGRLLAQTAVTLQSSTVTATSP
jgi:hypothetical protein